MSSFTASSTSNEPTPFALSCLSIKQPGATRNRMVQTMSQAEARSAAYRNAAAAAVAAAAASTAPQPATSAAASPPAPAAPPTEDAANDSGEAIDTFSGYTPTALPNILMRVLSENKSFIGEDEQSGVIEIEEEKKVEVIEIMDSSCDSFNDSSRYASKELEAEEADVIQDFATLGIASHTSPACESALLASVAAPRAHDQSAECLLELAHSKALSPLQLEGATLAITRHNRLLTDGNQNTIRAGFFIGDAAGVGKGRQIAAVLRDSMCRGRTRHLWVSVSRELALDAARDLQDLGCHCQVHDGSELLNQTANKGKGLGAGGDLGKGVLFVTYSLLVSGQGRRMEEIIQWLSGDKTRSSAGKKKESTDLTQSQLETERYFNGVIVFDEAHKAKNLEADTHTAKLVLKLQERLAHARVLYCSATGVSDIKHMVYANRLGLWGAGSMLYPTFQSFQETLANRGMGSLEMLALEMKQMGTFVARTLSWDGAEFETMEIALSREHVRQYDGAVEWWLQVKKEIEAALKYLDMTAPKTIWRAYWSAHQRFFREMAICAKIPSVVNEALQYLKKDCAIVIGLQSTGEASTQSALEDLGEQILIDSGMSLPKDAGGKVDYESILLPNIVSTARSVMSCFVRNHFPVALPPPDVPKVPPLPLNGFVDEKLRFQHMTLQAEADRIKNLPPPAPVNSLVEKQREILEAARKLDLPPNPLDDLIDRLGGESQVAELTGRSGRILRNSDKDQFHYVRRIQEQSNQKSYGLSMPKNCEDFDKINVVEKKRFMDGRKSVAIISDAASTGISLHAARGSKAAHKRRVHFTIELPWAADKAIQQLGRSHRSGQLSAPVYKMVVTELGGERRFGAAVSKRMANLGALTKGDRRAATGSDLSEFDIDSVYGRRALARVYQCLLLGDNRSPDTAPSRHSTVILDNFAKEAAIVDPTLQFQTEASGRSHALAAAQQALDAVGLASDDIKKKAQVKMFLNRIAGLPVLQQKLVFSLFMSTLDDVVADAKATGEFEGSVEDVRATHIEFDGKPEQLAVDKRSGAPTTLTRLNLDRGISLVTIAGRSLKDARPNTPEEEKYSSVAKSGFYVSKRVIAGRKLVLYAKRKLEADPETGEYAHDPLGLMVVTRPNTGKNPCEMSTRDLGYKYDLVLSSDDFSQKLTTKECDEVEDDDDTTESAEASTDKEASTESEPGDGTESGSNETPADLLRRKLPKVAQLWDDAHDASDGFDHNAGLAPRRSCLGLVTGAVLHILPALEKAVAMQVKASERALRVARVEISDTGERIVGIRFPLDDEVMTRVQTILKTDLSEASKGSAEATLFKDEDFTPVDWKSTSWATTERKTMRSFFGFSSSTPMSQSRPPLSGSKRKESPSQKTPAFNVNTKSNCASAKTTNATSVKASNSNTTTASIKSFFVKK